MYEWDDILILGDSFAFSRNLETDWPMALTMKLTDSEYSPSKIPRGAGYPGCSWWSTRTRLIEEIGKRVPKVLVLCHTEANRVPSEENYGLTFHSVSHKSVWTPNGTLPESDPVIPATVEYYTHLYSEKFHIWAMQQWFKDLDSIIVNSGIKIVIHLPCFGSSGYLRSNKGLTSEQPLYEIHKHLLGKKALLGQDPPGYRNHMDTAHSLHLTDAIYNAIINFAPSDNGKRKNLNIIPA